jgi:hypothetical protein
MNKKIFIKNKPFDVNDANDMQNWSESALKNTMASIYSSGIVSGLNVVTKTGLQLTVNLGTAFNSNYDFINVTANQTVTLAAANATNPRYDKIVISYSSSTTDNVDTTNIYGMGTSYIYSQNKLDSFQIQVVQGTPAASPVVPATPAGSLALAQVLVPAAASSIVTGNITDLRVFIAINSNINRPEVVFSATAPADTNVLWIDTTNNVPKTYKNSVWTILDSKDADTLDGQHGSYYATATHNHDTTYAKIGDAYTKAESDGKYPTKANNLSDLANITTARTNLGLGTAATRADTYFALAGHNHDGVYTKGDYVLTVGGTAPTADSKAVWWDTTNNLIKRYNGTSWVALNASDAATLGGASKGTSANNVLQLNSSGLVPVANLPVASGTANGAMSSTDKSKLDGIASGAEVNQNAFTNVSAGGSTLVADSKSDTLTINGGTNVTVTGDSTTDTVLISLSNNVETTTGAQTKADTAYNNAINWAKSLGYGDLISKLTNGTDLNTVYSSGNYYANSTTTNSPIASQNGVLEVFQYSGTTTLQRWTHMTNSATNRVFVRYASSGTWGSWYELENVAGAQSKADTAEANATNFAKSYGLGTMAKRITGGDMNNFTTESGFYWFDTTSTNTPVAGNGFYVIINAYSTSPGAVTQTAILSGTVNRMFFRRASGGIFNAWSEIETTTGAQSKADTAEANAKAASTPSSHVGTGGSAHANVVAGGAAGFMTGADKTKLDGIATGANNYTHPTGDGNLHVPATGTSNNAKVLKAGSAAGSLSWSSVNASEVVTDSNNRFVSDADKTKLNGIAAGAEVNQNTFSNVKVGATTIAADTETDTLELVAGTNVVLTPDATNDKVTIALSSSVETTTGSQAKVDTAIAALPKMVAGTFGTFSLSAGAQVDKVINYPAGKFSAIPSLTYSIFNADVEGAYTTASSIIAAPDETTATIRIKNKGTTLQYYILNWHAIEIK